MLRVFDNEEPEFLPLITDIQNIPTAEPGFACVVEATGEPGPCEVDWFGQAWLLEPEIRAYNPDVNNYVIKDIGTWEEYLTVPDVEAVDWQAKFEKDALKVDRENKLILIKDQAGIWERAF